MDDLRLYYADSKNTVREKLGIAKDDNDEDFDKFEVVLPYSLLSYITDILVRVFAPAPTDMERLAWILRSVGQV